jgi:hypothetical protein
MIVQGYTHVKRRCLSNRGRHFQCQNELPGKLINILWDVECSGQYLIERVFLCKVPTAARWVNLKNRVTPLLPTYTNISSIRCISITTTTTTYFYSYHFVDSIILIQFPFVLVPFICFIFLWCFSWCFRAYVRWFPSRTTTIFATILRRLCASVRRGFPNNLK